MAQDQDFSHHLESIGDTLSSAFSGIGPASTIVEGCGPTVGVGWGMWFAVVWKNVDPTTATNLATEIRAFEGKLQWAASEAFNHRGVRVSALPKGLSNIPVPPSSFVSETDLDEEILDFARYISRQIEAKEIRTKGKLDSINRDDAYGGSAYDVYLVRDPAAFTYDPETFELVPTSSEDARRYVAILNDDLNTLSKELHDDPGRDNDFMSNLLYRQLRIAIEPTRFASLDQFLDDLLPNLKDEHSRRVIQRVRRILHDASREGLAVGLEPTR